MASAGEALAMQDSVLRLVPDNERPVVHFWYHDKSDWSFVSPPPKKREKPALVGVQRAPIVAGAPKRNSLSDSMEQQWQSEIDAMPPEKRKFFAHFGESKTPTPGSSAAGSPRPSGDWLMELRHTWNAALDDGLHTVPPLDLGEPRQLLPHEISNVSSGLQQQQQPQERKRRRRPKRKRALPVAMHASSLSALAAQATASAASSDAESAGAASIGNGASVAAADDDGSETDTSDDESGPQQNGHSHSNGTSSSTASAASSASAARPPPFDFPPLRGDVVRPHGRMLPMSRSHIYHFQESSKLRNFRFSRMIAQMTSMFKPVIVMTVLLVLYVRLVVLRAQERDDLVFRKALVYKQPDADNFGQRLGGSFLNALMVLGGVFSFTIVFMLLFISTYRKLLLALLQGLIVVLLTGPWAYFVYQISRYYSIPIDGVSYALFLANFTAVGMFAIVKLKDHDSHLNRAFLLMLSLSIAWPFTEFPEWSVWITLFTLGVYDIVAVLSPCGPLKYLIDRGDALHKEPLPGLMYRGQYFMLGLGDFVFYGTLSGRAALLDAFTCIACTLAILMGLAMTIVLTSRADAPKALPALPLSIFLGLLFYVATKALIVPLCRDMASRQLFL